MTPERVMAAMSGGVDSSVAAALLLDMGYCTAGGTMQMNGLASEESAIGDAVAVCQRLGIPHYVYDVRETFQRQVIGFFARSYIDGLTPNPCVFCNRHVKFPEFIAGAAADGYGRIATGHYAITEFDSAAGRWILKKGADQEKDQSYFLYGLTQDMLEKTIFPLGGLTKSQVREIAEGLSLPSAKRPDSQDVCFIDAGEDYMGFLQRKMGYRPKSGEFIDEYGKKLGIHAGAAGYTIGQRRGLGVSSSQRLYVIGKDMAKNTVTLGGSERLMTRFVKAGGINYVSMQPAENDFWAQVKLRYSRGSARARVCVTGRDTAALEFLEPQRAPAPGQSAVFYDGDVVLGGGIIL